jgi:hypothetical protein
MSGATLCPEKPPVIGSQGTKFYFYQPKSKQEAFHRSQAKYKAMIGAFRSGKTFAACFEAIQHSLKFPGNVGLICRKDYTTLRDSTMKTFFSILPKDSPLVAKWNESTHDLWIKSPYGDKLSHIMFRGADEYQQFGSYELGWFWIDQAEQVAEAVWKMLCSRLSKKDVKLLGMITPNPPNQYHWIYRTFRNNPDTKYFTIHTSTYDNKEHLPEDYIADLEKQPENWKKMYLYGEFGFMAEGDPVYPNFISDVHVAKEPIVPIRGLPIVRSWDFGYNFPACGWYQVDPANDRVLKLAELMIPNMVIDLFADAVIKLSIERFAEFSFEDVADPAGIQKNDKSERTSIEIVGEKVGGLVISQVSYINDGLNLIRRNLVVRDNGQAGYLIDPLCNLTQEAYLGGYFMDAKKGMPDDSCHPYCDVADTDRYFFINKIKVKKQKQRKPYVPEVAQTGITGY